MRKTEKPSPAESDFVFEIDPEPAQETITSWGGVPLLVRAFRSLGLPQSVKQYVQIKQRQRGYDEATFVESLVILNAIGGDCLDDLERLRERRRISRDAGARDSIAGGGAQVSLSVSR